MCEPPGVGVGLRHGRHPPTPAHRSPEGWGYGDAGHRAIDREGERPRSLGIEPELGNARWARTPHDAPRPNPHAG